MRAARNPTHPIHNRSLLNYECKRIMAIEVIGRARELALDTIIALDNASDSAVRICSKFIADDSARNEEKRK
jgi:hypothetical protein